MAPDSRVSRVSWVIEFLLGGLKLVICLAKIEHRYILQENYCLMCSGTIAGLKVPKVDFQRQLSTPMYRRFIF